MAEFRLAARGQGWTEREEMLREVAGFLGYQRLGSNIKETLKGNMRAAIRRQIIEPDGDYVRAFTGSLTDYARDELRDVLCSVMRRGTVYDRDDVIQAATHYLGLP